MKFYLPSFPCSVRFILPLFFPESIVYSHLTIPNREKQAFDCQRGAYKNSGRMPPCLLPSACVPPPCKGSFQGTLSSFFIFSRRAACPLTEEIGKIMFIGKLQAVSDFPLTVRPVFLRREAGGVDFAGQDIFIRRLPVGPTENAGELRGGETGCFPKAAVLSAFHKYARPHIF